MMLRATRLRIARIAEVAVEAEETNHNPYRFKLTQLPLSSHFMPGPKGPVFFGWTTRRKVRSGITSISEYGFE